MNRLLGLLLLGLALCLQVNAQGPYEMLWEVKHPAATQPSYLFGTMHISDIRVYDLPDSVLFAMQSVQKVAFETDLDSFCVKFFDFVLGDGEHSINDLQQLENKLKGGVSRRGSLTDLLKDPEKFKRALQAKQDALADSEANDGNPLQFLDASLFRVAKQSGKETVALETLDSQLDLLLGLNGDVLTMAGNEGSVTEPQLRKLYLAGNLREIGRLLDSGELMGPDIKESLIDIRNVTMARGSDSLMRLAPSFVAVGAAHLPGKNGILEMLKAKGYKVRPVDATLRTGMMKAEMAKPYVPAWVDWEDPSNGVRMRLPAKPYRMDFTDVEFPMFAGLDFQGGFMYYFMAVPTAKDMTKSQKEEFARSFHENFNPSGNAQDAAVKVKVNGMDGLAFTEVDGKEHMRAQVLVGEEMAYVLFAGIDEDAVRSPALNEIFNSIREIPSVSLARGEWKELKDNRLGLLSMVPASARMQFEAHEDFPDLKTSGTWTWKSSDTKAEQEFWLAVSSLPPHFYYDSVHVTFNTIVSSLENGEFSVVQQEPWSIDGYPGLKATLQGTDDSRFLMRMIIRGNRLYMSGITCFADDPDKSLLEEKMDRFAFLPYSPSALSFEVKTPDFTARFPIAPENSENAENDNWFSIPFDSIRTWEARDPQSGYACFLTHATIGEYFRIGSMQALADTLLYRYSKEEWIQKAPVDWPGFDFAWEGSAKTPDGKTVDHIRLGIKGRSVVCLKTQGQYGEASSSQGFFASFGMGGASEPFSWTESKLERLLTDLNSNDVATREFAFAGLDWYLLSAMEVPQAMRFLESLGKADSVPDYAYTLIDKVIFAEDMPEVVDLRRLYDAFKGNAQVQVFMVSGLIQAETPAMRSLALELVQHGMPKDLTTVQEQDLGFGISGFLQVAVSPVAAFDSLAFLAKDPALEGAFWTACWELGRMGDLEERHLGLFKEDIHRIALDWIENPRYEPGQDKALRYEYDLMIWVLSSGEPDEQSLGLIQKAMDMGDPVLEEYAVLELLEKDIAIEKSRMKRMLATPGQRYYLTDWLLEHQQTKGLPKKFFKEAHLAEVGLEGYFQESWEMLPTQMIVHGKVEITYAGSQQYLYVFKVGFADAENWITGFAGPFPMGEKPAAAYLPLTGTQEDIFNPNPRTVQKQIDAWIELNGSGYEQEFD